MESDPEKMLERLRAWKPVEAAKWLDRPQR